MRTANATAAMASTRTTNAVSNRRAVEVMVAIARPRLCNVARNGAADDPPVAGRDPGGRRHRADRVVRVRGPAAGDARRNRRFRAARPELLPALRRADRARLRLSPGRQHAL